MTASTSNGEDLDDGDYEGPSRKPFLATKARPGSNKKIQIMRERVERGVSPFHKNDARLEDFAE